MAKKATNLESAERTMKVSELLLAGYSRSDIIRYSTDEKWDISSRQIDKYIQKATELYQSEVEEDRDKIYKAHIRKRMKLYKDAVKVGNTKSALAILDSMAKLDGTMIEKRHIEISGNLGSENLSDEELDKLIQKELSQGKDAPKG